MSGEAIASSFMAEPLQKNVIRTPTAPEPNRRDVAAYAMLKFIQAFESFGLIIAREIQTKSAAMDCEMVGQNCQENLFSRIWQPYIPICRFFNNHRKSRGPSVVSRFRVDNG